MRAPCEAAAPCAAGVRQFAGVSHASTMQLLRTTQFPRQCTGTGQQQPLGTSRSVGTVFHKPQPSTQIHSLPTAFQGPQSPLTHSIQTCSPGQQQLLRTAHSLPITLQEPHSTKTHCFPRHVDGRRQQQLQRTTHSLSTVFQDIQPSKAHRLQRQPTGTVSAAAWCAPLTLHQVRGLLWMT